MSTCKNSLENITYPYFSSCFPSEKKIFFFLALYIYYTYIQITYMCLCVWICIIYVHIYTQTQSSDETYKSHVSSEDFIDYFFFLQIHETYSHDTMRMYMLYKMNKRDKKKFNYYLYVYFWLISISFAVRLSSGEKVFVEKICLFRKFLNIS